MNKKQVIILWISLSLLVPILYFGGKTLFHYNRDLRYAKDGLVPEPIEKQSQEYRLKIEREHFIDLFSFVVLEIVSISGLLIFAFHKQNVQTR